MPLKCLIQKEFAGKRHSLPDYNFPDKMLDEQSQTPFQIQP